MADQGWLAPEAGYRARNSLRIACREDTEASLPVGSKFVGVGAPAPFAAPPLHRCPPASRPVQVARVGFGVEAGSACSPEPPCPPGHAEAAPAAPAAAVEPRARPFHLPRPARPARGMAGRPPGFARHTGRQDDRSVRRAASLRWRAPRYVAAAAGLIAGSTPTTAMLSFSRSASSPAPDAVLQATTSTFAPSRSRNLPTASVRSRITSSERPPYGTQAVSAR